MIGPVDVPVTTPEIRTSPKKARTPQAKTQAFWDAIAAIAAEYRQPMTVRQVFYQCVSRGVVEKTELNYKRVAAATVQMRLAGELPYQKIADGSRTRRTVSAYDSLRELFEESRDIFRRDLWRDQSLHVELWCEKDALSGVLQPVCEQYQVPYVATRGFPSLSLRYESARAMIDGKKPTVVLYLGDHDASGQSISNNLEPELRQHGANVHVSRVALSPSQVEEWSLPTRPGKKTDSRQAGFAEQFGEASVEIDALRPDVLIDLVEQAIVAHIDPLAWERLQVIEAAEQETLDAYTKSLLSLEEVD